MLGRRPTITQLGVLQAAPGTTRSRDELGQSSKDTRDRGWPNTCCHSELSSRARWAHPLDSVSAHDAVARERIKLGRLAEKQRQIDHLDEGIDSRRRE